MYYMGLSAARDVKLPEGPFWTCCHTVVGADLLIIYCNHIPAFLSQLVDKVPKLTR